MTLWKTNDELRPAGWQTLKKELYQSRQDVIDILTGKDDTYLYTNLYWNIGEYISKQVESAE